MPVFADGDAQSTTVMCGVEFRDAELGGEFGLVPHHKFHRRAGVQSSQVWGSFASGQATIRSVMLRKMWLMVRRGSKVDLVVLVESLECGVEVLVRLKVLRKKGRQSLANNTIESPNIASTERDAPSTL